MRDTTLVLVAPVASRRRVGEPLTIDIFCISSQVVSTSAVAETGCLTAERILSAAEEVVRRHGAAKATVVDVAQALGVSHGSIYRFFPSKVALREAVVGVWLNRIADNLETVPNEGTAHDRLKGWFAAHLALKKSQRASDPELFEAFRQLSFQFPEAVRAYKERLAVQIAGRLEYGCSTGEIVGLDAAAASWALLSATTRFHNPAFASEWDDPQSNGDFEILWSFLSRSIFLQGTCP